MPGIDKDSGENSSRTQPTMSLGTAAEQVSGSTPFVYPIRSLLSTVQPQPAQQVPTYPSASSKGSKTHKRDEDPIIYSLSASNPYSRIASPPRSTPSPSSSQRGASLTFPSQSRVSALFGDQKAFTPLPPLSKSSTSAAGSDQDRAPVSSSSLPSPPQEQQHPPLNEPRPRKPDVDTMKVQDFGRTDSLQGPSTVQATSSLNILPNGEASESLTEDAAGDVNSGVSDATSAAVTAVSSHMENDGDSNGSITNLVRLPPATAEESIKSNHGSLHSQNSLSEHRPNPSQESGGRNAPAASGKSSSFAPREEGPPVTVRFKFTVDENGHHHVVGRDGVLTRCEDEVSLFSLLIQRAPANTSKP